VPATNASTCFGWRDRGSKMASLTRSRACGPSGSPKAHGDSRPPTHGIRSGG
jgi:hypothetical protein